MGKVENLTVTNNTIKTRNTEEGDTWVSGFATGLGNVSGTGVFSNNTVESEGAGGFIGYGIWIADSGTADWLINDNALYGRGGLLTLEGFALNRLRVQLKLNGIIFGTGIMVARFRVIR